MATKRSVIALTTSLVLSPIKNKPPVLLATVCKMSVFIRVITTSPSASFLNEEVTPFCLSGITSPFSVPKATVKMAMPSAAAAVAAICPPSS